MALKFSEEFIKKQVAKGYPESMYRSSEWKKEQYYKKNNSMPKDMENKYKGLRDEGFTGGSLDKYLDDLDRFREDDY